MGTAVGADVLSQVVADAVVGDRSSLIVGWSPSGSTDLLEPDERHSTPGGVCPVPTLVVANLHVVVCCVPCPVTCARCWAAP